MDKEQRLIAWLREQRAIAIGYSGGVDSSYLAAVAVDALGGWGTPSDGDQRVLAIIGRSASYPASQLAAARATADHIGLAVVEIDTDELADPRYAANPTNRCYFCKTELWSKVVPLARSRGISVVADGTNADDLTVHRPGARGTRARRRLAAGAIRVLEARDPGALARARPADLAPCVVALSVVENSVRHAGDRRPAAASRTG